MDIFDYSTNREEFARAAAVIPGGIYGHLGPARGCHMPVSAYPVSYTHLTLPTICSV